MADPRIIIDAPAGLLIAAAHVATKALAQPPADGVTGKWRTSTVWEAGDGSEYGCSWGTYWGRNNTLHVEYVGRVKGDDDV